MVYHGTTQIIEHPDINHSKKYLDFGPGFYLTSYEDQSKKWALRKGLRQEKNSVVNVYELKENLENYRVLSFDKENEQWLDFVCACRKGEEINRSYDIIIGSVANDDVFKTVDMLSDTMGWSSSGYCGKKQPMPVSDGGPDVKCRINIGGR